MNKTADFILSEYREIAKLDKKGRVSLVFNDRDKRVYVKKVTEGSSACIYAKVRELDFSGFPRIKEIVSDEEKCMVIEEYISGLTVRELVEEKGAVENEKAEEYICRLCKTVALLHENGIIHRDITYNNVMITDDGGVKLIDFGIAHKADSSKDRDTVIMGTRGFAAPEQFGFSRCNERTDIYSIGILYNYMLTGTTETNSCEINKKAEKIVEKCTRFSPEERFVSCSEIISCINQDTLKDTCKYHATKWYVWLSICLVLEMILVVGAVEAILKGESITENIGLIVDGAMFLLLPFFMFGNLFDWQKYTPVNRLNGKARTAALACIYSFLIIVYVSIRK